MSESIQERRRLFRMVRDISYFISLDESEQDYCCVTKPFLLDRLLGTIGLKSRHILCTFRWEDLPLPADVMKHSHDAEDTHEYLEVFTPEDGKWVKVDPNWDSRLRSSFNIAEWDGVHDTILAVTPLRTYSPEESEEIIKAEEAQDASARIAYIERNRDFFQSLNVWLAHQRVKRA